MWQSVGSLGRCLSTTAAVGINKPKVMKYGFRVNDRSVNNVAEFTKPPARPGKVRYAQQLYPRFKGSIFLCWEVRTQSAWIALLRRRDPPFRRSGVVH